MLYFFFFWLDYSRNNSQFRVFSFMVFNSYSLATELFPSRHIFLCFSTRHKKHIHHNSIGTYHVHAALQITMAKEIKKKLFQNENSCYEQKEGEKKSRKNIKLNHHHFPPPPRTYVHVIIAVEKHCPSSA